MPIKGLAATVVAHRGARVGVAGRFLHVTQRDAGVQGGGDEGVTQRVRSDPLADPGTASDTAHDPPSSMPIDPFTVGVEEDRTFHTFADSQVDCPGDAGASGIVTNLPPLRNTVRVRWPRSSPRASMLAPIASDTRNPFNASSETNAWSRGDDRPAVTRIEPNSLRSKWAT